MKLNYWGKKLALKELGVMGIWNDEEKQLYIFRAKEHFTRLLQSAQLLLMEFDMGPEDLTNITIDLLKKEDHHQDVYIRPLVYKSDELIGVKLHDLNANISIVSLPFSNMYQMIRMHT